MEKSIMDIISSNGPLMGHNIGNNHMHSGRPYNQTESLFKIYTRLLKKSFGNEPCFSEFNRTVYNHFVWKSHLHDTMFKACEDGMRDHVWSSRRAVNSLAMASSCLGYSWAMVKLKGDSGMDVKLIKMVEERGHLIIMSINWQDQREMFCELVTIEWERGWVARDGVLCMDGDGEEIGEEMDKVREER